MNSSYHKAISSLYVPWSPPMEKSRLIGFSTAGTWIGNVVALPVGKMLFIFNLKI